MNLVVLKYHGEEVARVSPPTPPARTLEEYRRARLYGRDKEKDDYWQCFHCTGAGRVVAPYERPCPVEGYKMADRIACPSCDGKGHYDPATGRVKYRAAWDQEKKVYKEKVAATAALIAAGKAAMEKLNSEELAALRALLDLRDSSGFYGSDKRTEVEITKRKDFTRL